MVKNEVEKTSVEQNIDQASEKKPVLELSDEQKDRLEQVEAELFEIKTKAKGDAKNNLKLVELERAKELLVERKKLQLEGLEGRDAESFLNRAFDHIEQNKKTTKRSTWPWKISADGTVISMSYSHAEDLLPSHLIDKKDFDVSISFMGQEGEGIEDLRATIKRKKVVSVLNRRDLAWVLVVLEEKDKPIYKMYALGISGNERKVDISNEASQQFGFNVGDRVNTPLGKAVVIGVYKKNLIFHWDGDTACYTYGFNMNKKDYINKGFSLVEEEKDK